MSVLALAGCARAGLNVLKVEPTNAVSIRLEVGDDGKEATLYLPRLLLGKAKRTDADGKQPHAAVWPSTLAVWLGLALTLAIAGRGFLPLRRRPGGKALLLILTLAAILIAGRGSLWADVAPWPFQQRRPSPPLLDPLVLAGGKIRVEVTDEGDAIRLVVPKSQLAEWATRLHVPEK